MLRWLHLLLLMISSIAVPASGCALPPVPAQSMATVMAMDHDAHRGMKHDGRDSAHVDHQACIGCALPSAAMTVATAEPRPAMLPADPFRAVLTSRAPALDPPPPRPLD